MDLSLLRRCADQGMTRHEIADVLGIPISTVSNNCTKYGIKTKRPDMTGKRPLKESVRQTLELRDKGLSYRDIAKRLNIPLHRVAAACQDHGSGGAKIEQRLTESQVADYVSRSGFDYVGGFQSCKKPITVRCRDCGRTFERQFHVFRDVANGTWLCNNECPLCRSDKHEAEREQKEIIKVEREHEAQKRAQQRAERLSREVSEELIKRLAIHVCKNCGNEFCQMVTGYNSKSYCSEKCQKRYFNRRRCEKRHKKLMARDHDSDISLEKLFKRDRGVCYLCGDVCDWTDGEERDGAFIAGPHYPSIDHIVPVSKGGTHTWDNIKLACRQCNWMKSDAT